MTKKIAKIVRTSTRKTFSRRPIKKRLNKSGSMAKGPFRQYIVGDPLPPQKFCRFNYSAQYSFTTGLAGIYGSEQIMNLNSLFDPDYLTGGHQPLFYDQMAAMYRQYKVHGVLCEWEWTDPSADGIEVAMQVQASSETATITNHVAGSLQEQPMTVVRHVNNTGNQKVRVKQYFPIWQVEGLSKLQFDADTTAYCAPTNADPSISPLLRFAAASVQGTAGATIQCFLKMTFYAKLYERIIVAQS